MNYKIWCLLILSIGILSWVFYFIWCWNGAFYYQNYVVFLMMINTLTGFIAFIHGIIHHNKKYEPLIPLILSILIIIPVPTSFAENIHIIKFNHNLTRYEDMVTKIESNKLNIIEGEIQNLPPHYPAYSVRVYSFEDEKIVKFTTGMGRVHWGYYYEKDDSEKVLRSHFKMKKLKRIRPQWFYYTE